MPVTLTDQQVLALALDSASAKAGNGLANASKWSSMGQQDQALWGLCQGSGKNPYQVRVDLSQPAFKCSCPSRKFPCKHALGLLLIAARQPQDVPAAEAPDWMRQWLEERQQRAERKEARAAAAAEAPPDPQAQARRAAQRDAKVAAGVGELRLWLEDLVRQGLATAQTRPARDWEIAASRMVDAQAPGLARVVRNLGEDTFSLGWQQQLLGRAGNLYLLLQAYCRIDALPSETQADVRSLIGWTLQQDEVLATGAAIRDRWLVLAQHVEEETRLRVQSTWLWGHTTDRPAVILTFAAGATPLETPALPGTVVDADIVYYPGAAPLRALIKAQHATAAFEPPERKCNVTQAIQRYAKALARCPWIERWPMLLGSVVPQQAGADSRPRWAIQDDSGMLPIDRRFEGGWELAAISGGRPMQCFGLWDGWSVQPLAAFVGDRLYRLGAGRQAEVSGGDGAAGSVATPRVEMLT